MRCSTSAAMVGTIWNALAPGADHRHPLAGEVGAVDPLRRVHGEARRRSRGPAMSGSLGRLSWPTALMTALAARVVGRAVVGAGGRDRPPRRRLVPAGRGRPRCSKRMWSATPKSSHAPLEVGLQLGLLGEELGPLVVGGERVAVEVVAHVDPAARVAVLEPGAARRRRSSR